MMRRRQFLGATVAVGAASVWPTWLKEAFGDPATCQSGAPSNVAGAVQSAASLTQAFRNARRAGRPLLVIVIPADDAEKHERGQAWGALLNFGSDEQLAPLSSVEVACATMDAVKLVVPNDVKGDPFFALVTTAATPSTVRGFDVELDSFADVHRPRKISWEDLMRDEEAISDARIAALANALKSALGAPTGDVGARAADVRERLKDGPPLGARWAHGAGCGVTVEGDDNRVAFGCGMGHVPVKSRRFLYFFSRDRSQR
jgi:hypothetical protein